MLHIKCARITLLKLRDFLKRSQILMLIYVMLNATVGKFVISIQLILICIIHFYFVVTDAISSSNPRVIDDTRARKLSNDLKRCTYYETCATYGLNVERVFQDGKDQTLIPNTLIQYYIVKVSHNVVSVVRGAASSPLGR